MEKQKKVKIGYIVKGYLFFPLVLGVLLLALSIVLFYVDEKAGYIALIALVVYCIIAGVFIGINQQKLRKGLLKFARDYESLEAQFIKDFPMPYAVTDAEGVVLVYNERFRKIYEGEPGKINLCTLFKELQPADVTFGGEENNISIVYDKRNYRLHLKKVAVPRELAEDGLILHQSLNEYVLAVYLFDETEIVNMMKAGQEQQLVIGSLCVDNFEEIQAQVEDVRRSFVTAMIDREVGNYFTSVGGVVRKIEKDRYFIIFKRKYLPGMQRNKFDLLDNVKAIDVGIDMKITVSMGVGVSDSYRKCQDAARSALELALGRGGDQVVVKENERTYFYGGRTKSVEKNTRVKARVTALVLKELILRKERVVVMGHKTGDIDCFGASIGIYAAAKALDRRAYVVLNELTNTVQPVLENFLDDSEFGSGVFIPVSEAPKYVDENTLLVIVDVNKPDFFECPELTDRAETVVLIDHHLQSGDKIPHLELSYIEPTASSASEMVTEILQYITDDVKLRKIEAEALYAGILIDTNYFSKNTGVRTFEAAAILRKSGVDVAQVNRLFSDTLEDYKAKAEAGRTIEIIEPGFAMATCTGNNIDNPTVIAAQVANEILDIGGISASFVLLDYKDRIYISARSNGNVNVQLVMERMGGGGHLNSAGAQLAGETLDGASKKLKLTVRKMIEEGTL